MALIGPLVSTLVRYAGPWIVQGLVFVGLSFATTVYALPPMLDFIAQQFNGAPQVFVDTVGYVRGDVAMSMILSAHLSRSVGKLSLKKRKGPTTP